MSEYSAPSLVVLVGPPGAGKTTWLEKNLPNATRISLEAIRRDPKADRNAILTQAFLDTFAALKTDTIVVFDSTAIQEQVRNRLRGIARYAGAPVYAVIFDEPLDDLIAAQASRKYPVPIARVRELYEEFQAQLATIPAEGWDGVETVSRAEPDETPQIDLMRSRTMITQTRDQLMGGVSPLDAEVEPGSAPDDETLKVDQLPCDLLEPLDTAEDATEGDTVLMEELAGVERAYSPIRVQYRASGAGKQFRVISGYAARFDSLSEDLGGFRELIAPGAFANAIKDADIRLLYNHDPASVLARTGVNLELEEDELGLRMWARVDTTDPDVARVASKLSAGLIDGASFGFTVAADEWDDSGLIPIRTIREIGQCFEVTVCAWPAYPATRVGIMDDAIRSGRLQLGGATHTAPILAGGESRDVVSGMGTISAAAWRARLSYRQHETKRYIK